MGGLLLLFSNWVDLKITWLDLLKEFDLVNLEP